MRNPDLADYLKVPKKQQGQLPLKNWAKRKVEKSWIFTLHAPSLVPALQYLDDDELRKEIWTASDALGSEKPYDNQSLIATILQLRQEKAELLGKSDFSEVALSRRMAKSGERADTFISELTRSNRTFLRTGKPRTRILQGRKNRKKLRSVATMGSWLLVRKVKKGAL